MIMLATQVNILLYVHRSKVVYQGRGHGGEGGRRGGGGGGGERVKARPSRTDPEDRGDRGPPPEQWKC